MAHVPFFRKILMKNRRNSVELRDPELRQAERQSRDEAGAEPPLRDVNAGGALARGETRQILTSCVRK
jgi:hypothetical protein